MSDEEQPPQPVWEPLGTAGGQYDEEGLPHGQGVMKYPPAPVGEDEEEKPGDTYEGNMEHGKRHGQGKYTWGKTGATYVGQYENGQKHGQGTMTYPDKSVYQGQWVQDVIEGTGRYVYASGDIYQGEFKSGKRHGQGSYHNQRVGCQYVGRWEAGGFVSGHWILKDGSMFAGAFKNGVNPAEGAYFFSRSQLLQPGAFTSQGEWVASTEPFIGGVDKLREMTAAALAPPAPAVSEPEPVVPAVVPEAAAASA